VKFYMKEVKKEREKEIKRVWSEVK
jgi:hypothetical protein